MRHWNCRQKFMLLPVLVLLFFSREASAQYPKAAELLRAAKEAAAWLDSLAVRDPGTGSLRWPMSPENASSFRTGLDRGAAGIGTFFLRLYDATGDPAYLDRASGAALFIAESYRRGEYFGPDWLSGAASGGTFALDLYRRSGQKAHLKLAKLAATRLMKTAHTTEAGFHWDHSPGTTNIYVGIPHGAAGIGLFLLDLYSETADPQLLRYAKGAHSWTNLYSVDLPSGAKGYKRLITDNDIYVLWSGSTGMITFQNALWKSTGDRAYLTELERTAESLLEHAVPQRKGIAWPYHPGTRSFPTPYFHGAASTIEALLIAYEATGRSEFRDGAMQGAKWLMSIKRTTGSKAYYWPHSAGWNQFDTGLGVGTASVGAAFARLYKEVPRRNYLANALGAARHLLKVSERVPEGQRSWINYTNEEDPEYALKEHSTGWADGAAGIGVFLLELFNILSANS